MRGGRRGERDRFPPDTPNRANENWSQYSVRCVSVVSAAGMPQEVPVATKTVKLVIDPTLYARVERAVDEGHAESPDEAITVALRGWLRSVGSPGDDLDIDFDHYADLLLQERISYHGSPIAVLGPNSYVEEIEFAQDAFHDHGMFAKIPLQKRERVAGFGSSNGYLGRMEGAARFKPVVRQSPELIGAHLDALPIAGPVSQELIEQVVRGLCAIRGVGLPSATRLLSVKRPDLFLPVNGANRDEVVERFGPVRVLPEAATEDYFRILRRVHEYPWFNADRPPKSEVERRSIWDYRVALLDALLYAPTEGGDEAEEE